MLGLFLDPADAELQAILSGCARGASAAAKASSRSCASMGNMIEWDARAGRSPATRPSGGRTSRRRSSRRVRRQGRRRLRQAGSAATAPPTSSGGKMTPEESVDCIVERGGLACMGPPRGTGCDGSMEPILAGAEGGRHGGDGGLLQELPAARRSSGCTRLAREVRASFRSAAATTTASSATTSRSRATSPCPTPPSSACWSARHAPESGAGGVGRRRPCPVRRSLVKLSMVAPSAAPLSLPGASMQCATHPDVETELSCGSCGKAICPAAWCTRRSAPAAASAPTSAASPPTTSRPT